MDELHFQQELQAMLDKINGLPDGPAKDGLVDQAKKAKRRHEDGKKAVAQLEETLSVLRIHVQYIQLDLEATKRENAQLRKQLEDYWKGDDDDV